MVDTPRNVTKYHCWSPKIASSGLEPLWVFSGCTDNNIWVKFPHNWVKSHILLIYSNLPFNSADVQKYLCWVLFPVVSAWVLLFVWNWKQQQKDFRQNNVKWTKNVHAYKRNLSDKSKKVNSQKTKIIIKLKSSPYSSMFGQCRWSSSSKSMQIKKALLSQTSTGNLKTILKGLSNERDFKNVNANWKILALINAAASLWIFLRQLWLVEIKHLLSCKCYNHADSLCILINFVTGLPASLWYQCSDVLWATNQRQSPFWVTNRSKALIIHIRSAYN